MLVVKRANSCVCVCVCKNRAKFGGFRGNLNDFCNILHYVEYTTVLSFWQVLSKVTVTRFAWRVVAGLAVTPADWKAGGAYYRARNISGLLDFNQHDQQAQIKLLSPIPPIVSRLLPPTQHEETLRYFGVYAEAIDRLYKLIPTIPRLGESVFLQKQAAYLRYFTDAADYFICEYDGENTMYGIVKTKVFPAKTEYSKFCLTSLKNNQHIKLDFSWQR